jgi:hypothetical protein
MMDALGKRIWGVVVQDAADSFYRDLTFEEACSLAEDYKDSSDVHVVIVAWSTFNSQEQS